MLHYPREGGSIIQSGCTKVQTYMMQVYGWMTCGLLLTAFVAWYIANNSTLLFVIYSNKYNVFGLILLQLGIVSILSSVTDKISGILATGLFMLYSILTGITFSSIFLFYTYSSIANSFIVTSGMFGSMSLWSYSTKRNLSGIGSILLMVLVGFLLASILNIWLKSTQFMWLITYAGVLIFSVLTAYHTQHLKKIGEQINESDPENLRRYAIRGALTLYLDFINLFLMLLRILSNRR
ncbi:MAG: Bax inhibitor-1/YccA family protein [Candidatus Dasytiphilus stammeri]